MSRRPSKGFTLVEILIVVVILGILAALVVPQMVNASNEAVKSALARQVQMINHQVELYRIAHEGVLPSDDEDSPMIEGGLNNGWGAMISIEYLKEQPFNPYTKSTLLVAGDFATAVADVQTSANGWYYELGVNSMTVYAAGYNKITNTLSHELE